MWVPAASYDTVIAFVAGYDEALSGGLLVGFREWLIVEIQDGNNLSWSGLIREVIRRSGKMSMDSLQPEDHAAAIELLFLTIEEFLTERDRRDGLHRIYLAYDEWLRQQTWYKPSHPHWLPLARAQGESLASESRRPEERRRGRSASGQRRGRD
jgi:hypothetical protein